MARTTPGDRGSLGEVNKLLLERIPITSRHLLEVGCGEGDLGAAYKAINPSSHYVGIETDSEAANNARHQLDCAICANYEDPNIILPSLSSLDCLIYKNSIQHTRNPLSNIQRHTSLLSDEGVLLACIPNIRHWSVIYRLIHGSWPQDAKGISDRSCLHLLTLESLIESISQCGLELVDVLPLIDSTSDVEHFISILQPSLPGLGTDTERLLSSAAPLQYIIRATRKARQPIHIDWITERPQGGLVDVRVQQPMKALTSQPFITTRYTHEYLELLPPDSSVPRLLILQRPVYNLTELVSIIRKALDHGYLIISEYDDDPAYWPNIEASRYLEFRGMHAVQVSTEPIAQSIIHINPEVAVFKNMLEYLPPQREKWDGQVLRVFFGAVNRERDWEPWIETLNRVFAANPERWHVEVVSDRKFFDALTLPSRNFTPFCNYRTYLNILRSCHIAFMPLLDCRFNRMKSDLKALEAGGNGLAILASPTVYNNSLVDGETCRIFNSSSELETALMNWLEDPVSAWMMGRCTREWIKQSRLEHHQASRREAWYRSLWGKRDQLTQLLLERAPELSL